MVVLHANMFKSELSVVGNYQSILEIYHYSPGPLHYTALHCTGFKSSRRKKHLMGDSYTVPRGKGEKKSKLNLLSEHPTCEKETVLTLGIFCPFQGRVLIVFL